MYAPGGTIVSWNELLKATSVVKAMFAISQDAYDEACSVMGAQTTAVVIACLLERASHINSPGGYLRDLTRRAQRHEFSASPMIAALLRPKPAQAGAESQPTALPSSLTAQRTAFAGMRTDGIIQKALPAPSRQLKIPRRAQNTASSRSS
jgi:hypothetical protein